MKFKVGERVRFYSESRNIWEGRIFRVRKFPKRYFIETSSYVYTVKENNIISSVN